MVSNTLSSPKTEQYKQWLSSLTETAVEKAIELNKNYNSTEVSDATADVHHNLSISSKWTLNKEERLVASSRIMSLLLQWKPDLSTGWKNKVRQAMPVLEQAFYLQSKNREEYVNPLLLDLQLKKLLSHFQADNGLLLLQNRSPVHSLTKDYYYYSLSCTSFHGHEGLQDPLDWGRANLPSKGTVATLMSSELRSSRKERLDEITQVNNGETLDDKNSVSETLSNIYSETEILNRRFGGDFAVLKKIMDLLLMKTSRNAVCKRKKVNKKKKMQKFSYGDLEPQIQSQDQATDNFRTENPNSHSGRINLLAILGISCGAGGAASPILDDAGPLPNVPETEKLGFADPDKVRSSSSCSSQLAEDDGIIFTDNNHINYQEETSLTSNMKKKKATKKKAKSSVSCPASPPHSKVSETVNFRRRRGENCHGDCNRDSNHQCTVKHDHVNDSAGMSIFSSHTETPDKLDKTFCDGDKKLAKSNSLLSCLLEENSKRDASDSRNTLHRFSSSSCGHGFSVSTSCQLSSKSSSSDGDVSHDDCVNIDKICLGINAKSMSFTSGYRNTENMKDMASNTDQAQRFKELGNCKDSIGESSRMADHDQLTKSANEPRTPSKCRTPLSSFLAEREEWGFGCLSDSWIGADFCPWDSWEEPAGAIDPMCCVCMVGLKGAAFTPCGHTFCRKCSRELWKGRETCPLCNSIITGILDIY